MPSGRRRDGHHQKDNAGFLCPYCEDGGLGWPPFIRWSHCVGSSWGLKYDLFYLLVVSFTCLDSIYYAFQIFSGISIQHPDSVMLSWPDDHSRNFKMDALWFALPWFLAIPEVSWQAGFQTESTSHAEPRRLSCHPFRISVHWSQLCGMELQASRHLRSNAACSSMTNWKS